jgi:hypothetical protein
MAAGGTRQQLSATESLTDSLMNSLGERLRVASAGQPSAVQAGTAMRASVDSLRPTA